MTADWVSWAVPKPNLEEVVRGALGSKNEGMGYNSTFKYPKQGGIETLPSTLASKVEDCVTLNAEVVGVDLESKTLQLANGESRDWERLVVTTDLPRFLNMLKGGPLNWSEHAQALDWSVVACLNLGINRTPLADGAHWIYFPDSDTPFYRAGFPTNFSDSVAPQGFGSMYVEFGLPKGEDFNPQQLQKEAMDALYREKILSPEDEIVVSDWIKIDPGYVIFNEARQQVMAEVLPTLESLGVHCIGRYGAWTYSYMERALLDGLECAEKLKEVVV